MVEANGKFLDSTQAYHRAVVAQRALYNRVCSIFAGPRTLLTHVPFKLFLNRFDLTNARLKKATSYFGLNFSLCFNTSFADNALDQLIEDFKH